MTESIRRKLHVVLRVDAGRAIGFGHAVRCLALLDAFGIDIDLTVAGDDITSIFSVFPKARHYSLQALEFKSLVLDLKPDILIVDLPKTTPELWTSLRQFDSLLIAVDDEGGKISADIVINGAGPEATHNYPLLLENDIALTGPDYALLRNAFANTRWRAPADRSIFVVVGSGARATDWALYLAQAGFYDLQDSRVTMTVGSSFPMIGELRVRCAEAGISLQQGSNAQSIAQGLAGSQVALITGGMIMPETLAVGTPAIVFPHVKNLVPETEWFAERGAIRDLRFDGGFDLPFIKKHLAILLNDVDAAMRQSKRGRALVDGLGARRVSEAILAVFSKRNSKK